MTAALTAIALMVGAGVFDVVPIPLQQPAAQVFPVDVDIDGCAEIGVLAQQTLGIFSVQSGQERYSVKMPEDTSAFDVFDADKDGLAEIVAVQRGRVLLLQLDAPESSVQELFRATNLLEQTGGHPAPHILGTLRDGEWLLAIPRKNALEFRTLDGEIVETHPLGGATESPVPFERPFMARSVYPNLVGPPGSVEMHIDQVVVHDAITTGEDLPSSSAGITYPGSPIHTRAGEVQDFQRWPWFPLRKEGDSPDRVLFALTEPDYEDTLIRIEQPESNPSAQNPDGVRVGPARRYRGSLIAPWQTVPDFNGDGYTDLLLWVSPQPGRSIDAVTQALASRSWPLELRVQCFDPEHFRFEPRSEGMIATRVPIWWFVHPEHGVPLHLALIGDFNGDGRTDVGFSTDANAFSAWTYNQGFPVKPDFQHTFPEPLERLETWGDFDGSGRISAVLRGSRSLYVLRPEN